MGKIVSKIDLKIRMRLHFKNYGNFKTQRKLDTRNDF